VVKYTLKILYAGNVANFGYVISKLLRTSEIEVDLLMKKNPPDHQDPLKKDPTLHNEYPHWIHFFDKKKHKWKRSILKLMREKKYDLIQAQSELIIFAYISRKSFVAQPVGSELRSLAFQNSIRGILMRRALKKAKAVIISGPEQLSLVRKLNLNNFVVIPFSPEFSSFEPMIVAKKELVDNFIIFHPANLDWTMKGNNILLEGFAKFVKDYIKASLIIIDWGKDSQKTHQLVKSLGIENKVNFLKKPLALEDLKYYYNMCDVVADQFVLEDIGAIGREAMCSQKPLLANFNEDGYRAFYTELPHVVKASTPQEVVTQLQILSNEKTRLDIGKKSREWMEKNNSTELFKKKIKILYDLILSGNNKEIFRQKINEVK